MRKRIIISVICIVISAMLAGCGGAAVFDGSKTGDADHFDVDFSILNSTCSHELEMKAGESLEVSVERKAGKISLLIQQGEDQPVYDGVLTPSSKTDSFVVEIEKSGKYKISITGDEAEGHVVVKRR